jgi:hypothetical protein
MGWRWEWGGAVAQHAVFAEAGDDSVGRGLVEVVPLGGVGIAVPRSEAVSCLLARTSPPTGPVAGSHCHSHC